MENKTSVHNRIKKLIFYVLNPLLWLWVLVLAPNLNKLESYQEILKSLIFLMCLGIFVMLPLFFIQRKFVEKLVNSQPNNTLANYKFNETVSTKTGLMLIGLIIVGIVGFVVLINLATVVSKWIIQLLF